LVANGIGALVGQQSLATVETAMTETRTRNVLDWCHSERP
jgi:hypothetical protein